MFTPDVNGLKKLGKTLTESMAMKQDELNEFLLSNYFHATMAVLRGGLGR